MMYFVFFVWNWWVVVFRFGGIFLGDGFVELGCLYFDIVFDVEGLCVVEEVV